MALRTISQTVCCTIVTASQQVSGSAPSSAKAAMKAMKAMKAKLTKKAMKAKDYEQNKMNSMHVIKEQIPPVYR